MAFRQLNRILTGAFSKAAPNKKKLALISLSAFLALISIISLIFAARVLGATTIYRGVHIGGTDVGGYTRDELMLFLENHFADVFDNVELTFVSPQFERSVSVSDLGIAVDIGAMAQKAYSMGRTGNVLSRTAQILKLMRQPAAIALAIDFETPTFMNFLENLQRDVYREIIPSNIIIDENAVTLCTGIAGQEADYEALKTAIIKAVSALKSARIEIPIIEREPPSIDVESALIMLNREPVNAEFIKTSRTTYEIKPHEMGMRIEREKLLDILSYIENRENKDYEEIPVPVEFIRPALTEDELRAQLFRDTLASFSTHFNTNTQNNKNRSINIGLAAQSIDGTLLMPGEEFSFNKIVGPRTPEKGYKIAHVFINGQIQDGTGGGICQVSTTLYNAVLRANLEVTERHNHMFTVGYVPLGHDAAVSYGYADLVFKNTTPHPVRIVVKVTADNYLVCKIQSTNEHPDLKVRLATKTISTIPIKEQYINDYSLPKGTAIVEENGQTGYVVDTYIQVTKGDVVIREEKLHRSYYQMLPRKIRRGVAQAYEMTEEEAFE